MRTRIRAALLAAVTICVCALGATAASAYTLPPGNGLFDYQLSGGYAPRADVRIASRDRLDDPVDPRGGTIYDVCYVNTFQTQPDELDWWLARYPHLLLRDARGQLITDGEWGEVLLDTRTSAKRTELAGIMGGWFAECADKGFDAIEPDNLDSWDRSEGLLLKSYNVRMMRLLTAAAHAEDLAIAQKGVSSELGSTGPGIGFDFSIVESCQVWNECGPVLANYGNLVYEIEYDSAAYLAACSARGAIISVILRDRFVVPEGAPGYTYEGC